MNVAHKQQNEKCQTSEKQLKQNSMRNAPVLADWPPANAQVEWSHMPITPPPNMPSRGNFTFKIYIYFHVNE
jgi:hypothetical protein